MGVQSGPRGRTFALPLLRRVRSRRARSRQPSPVAFPFADRSPTGCHRPCERGAHRFRSRRNRPPHALDAATADRGNALTELAQRGDHTLANPSRLNANRSRGPPPLPPMKRLPSLLTLVIASPASVSRPSLAPPRFPSPTRPPISSPTRRPFRHAFQRPPLCDPPPRGAQGARPAACSSKPACFTNKTTHAAPRIFANTWRSTGAKIISRAHSWNCSSAWA